MLEKLVGQGVGLWSRLKQRFETSLTTDMRIDDQGDKGSIPSQQTSSVYDEIDPTGTDDLTQFPDDVDRGWYAPQGLCFKTDLSLV
jgi:hypothetical protein